MSGAAPQSSRGRGKPQRKAEAPGAPSSPVVRENFADAVESSPTTSNAPTATTVADIKIPQEKMISQDAHKPQMVPTKMAQTRNNGPWNNGNMPGAAAAAPVFAAYAVPSTPIPMGQPSLRQILKTHVPPQHGRIVLQYLLNIIRTMKPSPVAEQITQSLIQQFRIPQLVDLTESPPLFIDEVNKTLIKLNEEHQRRIQPLTPIDTVIKVKPLPNPASTTAATTNPSVSAKPTSPHIDRVNTKLCEIILTLHINKEYVSRERVQQELWTHFHVDSWRQLNVHPSQLDPLTNLSDRLKSVNFFLQVFEHVFVLCTLHDLDGLIANFLKMNTYDDAKLGPLDENPDVQRIFKYEPSVRHQPIPTITSGDVIEKFIDFHQSKHQRSIKFDDFLDELVKEYKLQKREELGIYIKSLPYLLQVTSAARRDSRALMQRANMQVEEHLKTVVETRLNELKEELRGELELSSFIKKKSPSAVFDYLFLIVEKHLGVVPEQSLLFATLQNLRQNHLLQCLLNVSIYLGTIDKPEVFLAELQKLYQQRPSNDQERLANLMPAYYQGMSKKERERMKAMLKQQQNVPTTTNQQPANTFDQFSSLLPSRPTKPKTPIVSVKKLCSDLRNILSNYDNSLSIAQLLDVNRSLCAQYGVDNFSMLIGDEDDDDSPTDLISFLHTHRERIDPHGELTVFEHSVQTGANDRNELYTFVRQLLPNEAQKDNDEHIVLVHGRHSIPIEPEVFSAVEKAVKQKFGITDTNTIQHLIRKVKEQKYRNNQPVIRFEESLLNTNSLNQLGVCPSPSDITNESDLYSFILQSPVMVDLYTWLQWPCFFQSKYGSLKSFLSKTIDILPSKQLLLLETTSDELFRLPCHSSLALFEKELTAINIRTAVGHLCTLIIQDYGQINQLPLKIYRDVFQRWFYHLQSMATLHRDTTVDQPLRCILEFLTYLPMLLGRARIVKEIFLEPFDDIFGSGSEDEENGRVKLWQLADVKQKNKLEYWAHTLDIVEWKNETNKWQWKQHDGQFQEEQFDLKPAKIEPVGPDAVVPTVTIPGSPQIITVQHHLPSIPSFTTEIPVGESTRSAFEHVESIRHNFGENSDLDSAGQTIVHNLQGMIERSLEKLSNDLYSEQGHFVLELIQNADDNQYPLTTLPTLRFVLSTERILVCNNEIGFSPQNIDAICNVGASTKGKHKQGYAGHKGIGFKSVFMVSNRPEIHSRDYHICFDTVDGSHQLGYIRPIWLDEYAEQLPSITEWITCIRLPIKRDKQGDKLKRNFDDIQARLLLFLNRLRKIEIVREDPSDTRMFTRIDHANGEIIELREEKSSTTSIIKNFWLVVKKVIQVPDDLKSKLRDLKGEVDSTTVAIAYPLNGIQSSALPSPQPLFAYLPLRSYGFRFILQADFEIPATRQEILRDNLWNEWLKSEMIDLLPLAYEKFQQLPDILAASSLYLTDNLTRIQTLIYFLKLIPARGNELDQYFNAPMDKSIVLLMGIIRLPVMISDTEIEWVAPSQCVLVQDEFIRKIVSQDLLLSQFNSYYLHEQLLNDCDEHILIKLGCRHLDFSTITRLIQALYKQQQDHSTKTTSIEQIAQWLLCLDYSLQEQNQSHIDKGNTETTMMIELRQMKIIPLRQQTRLVSIDEFDKGAVLFPLGKSEKFNKHLKFVLDDLPTVDERLLDYIEDKHPRRLDSIRRLLKNLGVSEVRNIYHIYRDHILPVLSDDKRWPTKSESVLMAYLMCFYQYIYLLDPDRYSNDLKQLQTKLVVKTRDQNRFVQIGGTTIVHLTSTYGCNRSLESIKDRFTFISDDYYRLYRNELLNNDAEKYKFVKFLKELNMNDFLQVEAVEHHFKNVNDLNQTKWAYLITQLINTIGSDQELFMISDSECKEFDTLIATADVDLCVQLLLYFDRFYRSVSSYYSASVVVNRGGRGGQLPVQGIESSFCLAVRQHAWIPVIGGSLHKSTDVYYLPPSNNSVPASIVRRYLPHLDTAKVPLKDTDFIDNILCLKKHVLPMPILELFLKWSCHLDSDSLWKLVNESSTSNIIPCTLPSSSHELHTDTVENLACVYRFLLDDSSCRTLLARFRLWPLIFVARDKTNGQFLFAHQVFWHDPTSLLSQYATEQRISIQTFYGNDDVLRTFFIDTLGVEPGPTLDDYLPLLSKIDYHRENDLWELLENITRLTFEQNRQDEVRDKSHDIAFLPCVGDEKKIVKYTDRPFYPHNDATINQLFENILLLIKLPIGIPLPAQFDSRFCSLFRLQRLVDVIVTLVDVDDEQPSKEIRDFYTHSIDLIQHFLLAQSLISNERSEYLASIFNRMEFLSVGRINLSYRCEQHSTSRRLIDTYIDETTGKFYILKKFEKSESRLIDTMVNFIVPESVPDSETIRSKLASFIKKLLHLYQDDDEQSLVKLRNFDEHVHKWIIPQVIEVKKEEEPPLIITPPVEPVAVIRPTADMIKELKSAPVRQLPKSQPRPEESGEEKNQITSFPAKAGSSPSMASNDTKPNSAAALPPRSHERDSSPSTETDPSNRTTHPQEQSDGVTREKSEKREGDNRSEPSTENENTVRSGRSPQTPAPLSIPPTPPADFERIQISTLKDLPLSTMPSLPVSNSNSDDPETALTGRQGEEFVFRYLQWKYPDDDIKWVNDPTESGKPYDIEMIRKSDETKDQKKVELIEVKTTRVRDQHSFRVSIAEVECLLANLNSYHIYRVYYREHDSLPTITVLSRVKGHLQQKQLALFMTIPEQSNNST